MCFTQPELSWDDLPELFPEFSQPRRWLPLLQAHASLIAEADPRVRVTAVPANSLIRRQYAESLEHWRLAIEPAIPSVAVDIGPGGGFPGLLAAIVSPQTHLHLIEPLQKRARLLELVSFQLGLANVTVHAIRAEEAGRGALRDFAELVTARAVAELRELLEYTAPLAVRGGRLALAKGSTFPAEMQAATKALSELGCRLVEARPMRPEVSSNIVVALFEKEEATMSRYPRRSGIPAKRPL